MIRKIKTGINEENRSDYKEENKSNNSYQSYDIESKNASVEELELELINKLKIINKNHNTDIFIIESNINSYKELNKNTDKIFKDLTEK